MEVKTEKQYCGTFEFYVGGNEIPIKMPAYENEPIEELQKRIDAAIKDEQADILILSGGKHSFTITVKHDGEN